MIKPNQLCIILGVPQHKPGYTCNGKIVKTINIKAVVPEGNVWYFEPHLTEVVEGQVRTYKACADKWLHPLNTFEDELATEALNLTIERTFQETLAKQLIKQLVK